MLHAVGYYVVGPVIAVVLVTACAMKGKWGMIVMGIFPIVGVTWFVGAIRLAKPSSYWALRWYGEPKMAEAEQRFGRPAGVVSQSN